MTKVSRDYRKGLTLAEILVALAILSLALLTMIAVFIKNLSLSAKAEETTVATELCHRQLQNIRSMEPELIPTPANFTGAPSNSDGFPPEPYPSQTLDREDYNVEVSTRVDGDFVLVESTVSWRRGRLTLATLVRP